MNNSTVQLIDPGKNELGRISKDILDNINKSLCTSWNINQWKKTASVIQEEVLSKGLRFAQEYIDFTIKDTENITMLKNLYF